MGELLARGWGLISISIPCVAGIVRNARAETGDPRWEDPGLLPYDVLVSYSVQTNKVIGFDRIDPDSKEKLNDSGQDTSVQRDWLSTRGSTLLFH